MIFSTININTPFDPASIKDSLRSLFIKAIWIMSEIEFVSNHLSTTPPINCEFNIGDLVSFTNDYGMEFKNRRVIGFSDHMIEHGAFVHLSGASTPYWMPISPNQLKLERKNDDGFYF